MGPPDIPTALTAAECSARTGLSARALRLYEQHGLLTPKRRAGGWRLYGPAELVRLNTIVILKGLGLTLAQIRAVMSDHPPPLPRLLDLQADAWKAKISGAQHALTCIDAARHRLQCRHDLSIDDLCSLIKTLDENRSTSMQTAASITRDLINELITPEEERAWITWWAKHPEDAMAAKMFNEEQNSLFLQVQALADQGVDPASPEAQKLIKEHDVILRRHNVLERTVRLLDWNSSVTYEFYALGAEARLRQPKPSSDRPRSGLVLTQAGADFLIAARRESPRAPLVKAILSDANALLDAHIDPAAAEADDLVRRWSHVCLEHGLGDPYAVARCMPFLARVNRLDTTEFSESAWEHLARAIRVRVGKSVAL